MPSGDEPSAAAAAGASSDEPVVLEDLVALVRLPGIYRKVDRVLARMRESFRFPEDSPFLLVDEAPGDGVVEYGLRWRDADERLELFAGLSWGDVGHDPLWEVRIQGLEGVDCAALRRGGLLRMAARRAESRFSEWDRFWHEDQGESSYLIGASAACTRFLEEDHPDVVASDYLADALHALHRSGAIHALLEAAR